MDAERIEPVRVIAGSRARRARVAIATFVALLFPLAVVLAGAIVDSAYFAMFFLPALTLPLFLLRLVPRPRDSALLVGPGFVREARPFGLHLRARDVVGVSSCAHEGGLAMTVQLRHDPAPHTFVVKDEATLLRLREALGGGHDGGGALGWATQREQREVMLVIGGMAASAFCLGFLGTLFAFAFPFLRAFPKPPAKRESIMLTDQGLVWNFGAPRLFPYASIGSISRMGKLLFISPRVATPAAPMGHLTIPLKMLSEAEIDVLVSQVESAIRRARGERTLRESAIDRVQALRRNPSEPIREWLVRLEAVAAAVRGHDYRSAPVSAEDLWRITADPDETFEDRTAAGRVLIKAQGEEVRVRVTSALANSRAPEKRIRVVLDDDVELAADALDEDEREAELQKIGLR